MTLDVIAAALAGLAESFAYELGRRSAAEWIVVFAPLLVFLEIPRYYLPQVGVLLSHWLGLPRVDRRRREAFRRNPPRVSVIVAGRNEGATIESAIRSLLDQDYPDFEILVIDDASDDGMYEIARKHARLGEIRLIRNAAATGRSGRPSATNLGIRLASGEIVVSVDADCGFDRTLIREIVAPFADPRVGVVAGNVHVANAGHNFLTRSQALEYAVAIDLHKRWTDLRGCTLQASGAIGAFRRDALRQIRGWDQELAEDSDISLRMVKAGWKIAFAPRAVVLTDVPETLGSLVRQRTRWDRGGLRTYFRKHRRLLKPSTAGWSFATELLSEFFFFVVATLVYPIYTVWLIWQGLPIYLFVLAVATVAYAVLSLVSVAAIAVVCKRVERPALLLGVALLAPLYKGFFRWVRCRALVLELLRIGYEDPFLPDAAWAHAPRF